MSTAIRSPLLAMAPTRASVAADATDVLARSPVMPPGFSALDWVLADQQTLTAVDRFARKHEDDALPANAKFYRDLIPTSAPGAGQQYAFEVNLDVCTGCKACVTGCHNLNGLDDGEVWRTAGLLHGGTARAPAQQTVTTACHHCLEPACMTGCPVKAYDKDPVTGIVKHLDDQCIGCQYCVFMCPYDAPKFSKARGIVRKCDMCSDRLAHGEAPACVQSCPNEAIRIAVVDRTEAIQAAEANAFLPGAPSPSDTLPTTIYRSERALPRNMLPADFYSVHAQHAHTPLVVMLGLTQLSVGAFVLNLLARVITGPAGGRTLEITNALFALALGMAALGASTLHLGRPRYAFRAFLGLRTSWLSREILTFSAFAGLSAASAASFFVPPAPPFLRTAVAVAAAVAGIAGVFCSVMVYAATRRAHWRGTVTGFKFFLSALVLGSATVLMVSMLSSLPWVTASAGFGAAVLASVPTLPTGASGAPPFVASGAYQVLTLALLVGAFIKLVSELSALLHLRDQHHSVLKRTALLMVGDLGSVTRARFWCGALGALVFPGLGLVVVRIAASSGGPYPVGVLALISTAAFGLTLVGELMERYLFFAAAPASKMPGAIG